MSTNMSFQYPPPSPTTFAKLTFPADHIALVTMTRPEKYNCTNSAAVVEMTQVFRWIDDEPTIYVAVLTGAGDKAFSTGADLQEWLEKSSAPGARPGAGPGDAAGAIPLSNRLGKKPIVAAVNGLALGGGCETVMNCDIVVAAEHAKFGLVEVKRGLAAYAGALPRLIRIVGLQRASEMALTGEMISAEQAERWGFVNKIVPGEKVVEEALRYAKLIAESSPDSIICTRAGLRESWTTANVIEATGNTNRREWTDLQKGENIHEGLAAFKARRKPVWKAAKL